MDRLMNHLKPSDAEDIESFSESEELHDDVSGDEIQMTESQSVEFESDKDDSTTDDDIIYLFPSQKKTKY
ncbi:unnamed protein product [Brachionus calyciflorus]|uniref:Uncharacterized protein n=1 Tax=Brachionus calyciflorus TaxID=104777 RepID=A0A814MP10_9BILA|nr:unnamed protein product [Brachionus calyciflorus]